jgi:hypothetical protein
MGHGEAALPIRRLLNQGQQLAFASYLEKAEYTFANPYFELVREAERMMMKFSV